MKKIKFITLTILMLMLTVFTLTNIKTKDIEVKATETQEVNLKIYKNNVSYSSELYILYAVSYGDLEINKYEVQLLFFDTLQEEYVKGNEAYVAKSRGTTTVGGVKCLTFYSNGIAAKQMVDDIYTVAYVNINGVDYYSEVDKFSVLEYAHKALEEGAVNPHQRRLLQDLLKYGGAAQNVFDHNTHRPADATYYKITVIDGKLPDGFNHGRFQENEKVVITPIDKEGFKFSHWTDEEGIIVSYDKEFEITVTKKKEFIANYKDITSISSQLKMSLTVDYDTKLEEIDFPTAVSFEYGEETITLGITWDTTKFIANQIGVQKLFATLEDESAYEEYGISKEDIYLEINVLAYVFELNSETGEYKIVKYYGTEEKVEIPTTYNNTAISYICNKAFNENLNIKELIISSSITYIEQGAIYYCDNIESITIPFTGRSAADYNNQSYSYFGYIFGATKYENQKDIIPLNLTSVTLSEGATKVGRNAFYNCVNLSEINLSTTLEEIYYEAFYNCLALTEFTINQNLKAIDLGAFDGCKNLKKVYVDSLDKLFSIETGIFVSGGDEFYTPLQNGAELYINDVKVTEITIPNNIDLLSNILGGCSSITKITVPNSIKYMENGAFQYMENLQTVIFEEGSQLTSIGQQAFQNCKSLTNITIPSSVTSIGWYAFSSCTSLTNITIPSSVTSIDSYAFGDTYALSDVYYDGTFEKWCDMTIGEFASPMRYCDHIYMKNDKNEYYEVLEIEIPTSYTSIGYNFMGFKMTSLIIPSTISTISNGAFRWCDKLEKVTISSRVKSIGDYAFGECEALKEVIFEENSSLEIINYGAFAYCKSLANITIPSSVTSIRDNAFSNCTSLTNITIPSGVTSIGSSAFICCYNLLEVYNESELVFTPGSYEYGYIAYYALKVDNKGTVVYKDNATIYEYFTTEDGFKFLNHNNNYYLITYTGIDERPVLPATINGKTYKCQYMDSTLKDIELSSDFTSIPINMFNKCCALESIVIPNSITSIGSTAFYNCESLTNITFEEGSKITSIGSSAFYECTSLTNITIPSEVTSIGSQAFYYCTSLTNITIPSGVTSIGIEAFYNCTSLTIYCEAESQPEGWVSNWNYSNCPVVWGYNINEKH